MNRRTSLLAGLMAALPWTKARSQTAVDIAQMPFEEAVAAARLASRAPGLAAGWRRGDRFAVAQDGVRASGRPDIVRSTDIWHVGSITKAMTATLVARLVERGLMSWDETVGEAFAGIAPDMSADYRPATIAQLMTGRSGLPTNIGLVDFVGFPRAEADPRQSRGRWAALALAQRPQTAVGQGFVYPNSGYVLAGALCEARAGKPWETLMREEVFGPLGMAGAGFGPPPAPDAAAPANPVGHRSPFPGLPPAPAGSGPEADNPAAMGPAGRAHMPIQDLLAFGQAHLSGLAGGGPGLPEGYLKPETWARLHTPPEGSDYAMGWVRRRDGASWHNGSNTMFYAELLVDPATGTVAACAANLAGTERAVGQAIAAARRAAA